MVYDLMVPGTKEWDCRKMAALVCPHDINRIIQVHPSVTNVSDILSWTYAKNGMYSVKSGYYVQRQLSKAHAQHQGPSHPLSDEAKTAFYKLWQTNIPPKLKVFWWRIVHNSLPVAEALLQRRLKVDPRCQLCGEAIETINHMMFQCRITQKIWELAPLSTSSLEEVRQNTMLKNI